MITMIMNWIHFFISLITKYIFSNLKKKTSILNSNNNKNFILDQEEEDIQQPNPKIKTKKSINEQKPKRIISSQYDDNDNERIYIDIKIHVKNKNKDVWSGQLMKLKEIDIMHMTNDMLVMKICKNMFSEDDDYDYDDFDVCGIYDDMNMSVKELVMKKMKELKKGEKEVDVDVDVVRKKRKIWGDGDDDEGMMMKRKINEWYEKIMRERKEKEKTMRWDRHLMMIGRNKLKFIQKTKIMMIGLDGVGVEILKNLLLLGFDDVKVYDQEIVTWDDMNNGFIYRESDVGKKIRGSNEILNRMKYLNENSVIKEVREIKYDELNDHVVILINEKNEKFIEMLQKKIHKPQALLIAEVMGLTGRYFNCSKRSYKELSQCIPVLPFDRIYDEAFLEAEEMLVAYKAVHEFYNQFKRYPIPFDVKEEKIFIDMCKNENKKYKYVKMDILNNETFSKKMKKFCISCNYRLPPTCSIFGGIVSSEVLKMVCNQCSKPFECFVFEDLDVMNLPNKKDHYETIEEIPQELKRFSSNIFVLGKSFQKKIMEQKVFLVGAGATGSENAKLLALIGCCKLFITDMDTIELSNLNRQFLFQMIHKGMYKSKVVKDRLIEINPKMIDKIESFILKVQDYKIFDDEFYMQKDVIISSLDNIPARNFCAGKCELHKKVFFDSGTGEWVGYCNTYYPDKTEKFIRKEVLTTSPNQSCTVKNSPRVVDHLINWSVLMFNEIFNLEICNLKKGGKKKNFLKYSISSLDDCFSTSILIFEKLLYSPIVNLMIEKLEFKTNEKKLYYNFKPLKFNPSDNEHIELVVVLTLLLAHSFNINLDKKMDFIEKKEFSLMKKFEEDEKFDKLRESPFDKDNSLHILAITLLSKLRMINFNLNIKDEEYNEKNIRSIAGNVIFSIICSSSVSQGFEFMNYFKYISNLLKNSNQEGDFIPFKNYKFDLEGSSNFSFTPTREEKHENIWIKDLNPNLTTINDIIDHLEQETNMKCIIISIFNEHELSSLEKYLYYEEISPINDRNLTIKDIWINDNKDNSELLLSITKKRIVLLKIQFLNHDDDEKELVLYRMKW